MNDDATPGTRMPLQGETPTKMATPRPRAKPARGVDLAHVFAIPQSVAVGTRRVFASPLRLVDMAHLQAYARASSPCTLDSAWSLIDETEPGSEAARRVLRDTYLACEKWPPRLGTDAGLRAFVTLEGFTFWLMIVLGRDNPTLDEADFRGIADEITVDQHRKLSRIAYGVAPLDTLSRLITPDSFPETSDGPTNWGEVIYRLVDDFGWSLDQCAQLRVTQLAVLRSGGKVNAGKVDPPPGMGRFEFARRQRKFFGPDRDEDETSPIANPRPEKGTSS